MHKLITAPLVLLLLSAAASGDVATYSFPAFNATTTDGLVAATNSSVLTSAALLFDSALSPEFNSSEGFLLLSRLVDVWRAGDGGVPAREASFNTSFTVDGATSPVAFVVLLDRFPTFNNPFGLRGPNNSAASAEANATNGLAAVDVGTVKSYAPLSPDVGLNVTITPNRTVPSRTVWIEFNAVVHRLWVYVAAGGQPRPSEALLDTPLYLAGLRTTQTAQVGFFAATVRDVIVGVRDWDLTVDRFDGDDGKKGTSWLVILLAVLGSVAATAAIVSVVVCYFMSRRRALHMEQPKH